MQALSTGFVSFQAKQRSPRQNLHDLGRRDLQHMSPLTDPSGLSPRPGLGLAVEPLPSARSPMRTRRLCGVDESLKVHKTDRPDCGPHLFPGTARHPLIVTGGGQFFVGPDNGLLLPAAKRLGGPRVFHMNAQGTGEEKVSPTFHGRDLFAPVAARLVAGTPPQRLGRPTTEFVDLDLGASRQDGAAVVGHVVYADAFGNLID